MRIKDFINKITENWVVKAACILTAVFVYIFYTLSNQDSRSFTVPLRIDSSGAMTAAGSYPTRVKVTLKGATEEISSVRETDISAYIDLSYVAKDGTYSLPVLVSLPEQALLLDTLEVNVSPKEINLRVEEQISKFVPVSPLVNGAPAHGYEIRSMTLKPDTVEITGPRSLVENCERLQTRPLSVKNAEVSFETSVDTESPGAYLKLKDSGKISVTVEIAPVVSEMTFQSVSVAFTSIPEGLDVYPKNVTANLVLSGNLVDLEKFTPGYATLYVNCSSVTESGEYELPVQVSVSSRFSVKSVSLSTVKIEARRIAVSNGLEEKVGEDLSSVPGGEDEGESDVYSNVQPESE